MTDDLADVPPEDFVAARDALAKRLKAEGNAAEAAEVKRLRRPSVPAWIADQVRRHGGEVVDALVLASRDVAETQAAAFAGGNREALREATIRRRAALAAAGRAVDQLLADEGRPAHHRDEALRLIETEVVAEVAPGVFGLPDDLDLPEPTQLHGEAPLAPPTLVATEDLLHIRAAVDDDLAAIVEIYNSTIATTTAAWTEVPQTLDERRAWMADRQAADDVVLVAEEDGEVVGFAGYGEFRDNHHWPGYRSTVEHTIHVRESHRGQGVGGRLLETLVLEARAHDLHVMVAAIDGANDGSYRFHADHGFVEVARMPEVGRKFDRWLDLVLMQRFVDGGPGRPLTGD